MCVKFQMTNKIAENASLFSFSNPCIFFTWIWPYCHSSRGAQRYIIQISKLHQKVPSFSQLFQQMKPQNIVFKNSARVFCLLLFFLNFYPFSGSFLRGQCSTERAQDSRGTLMNQENVATTATILFIGYVASC